MSPNSRRRNPKAATERFKTDDDSPELELDENTLPLVPIG